MTGDQRKEFLRKENDAAMSISRRMRGFIYIYPFLKSIRTRLRDLKHLTKLSQKKPVNPFI